MKGIGQLLEAAEQRVSRVMQSQSVGGSHLGMVQYQVLGQGIRMRRRIRRTTAWSFETFVLNIVTSLVVVGSGRQGFFRIG